MELLKFLKFYADMSGEEPEYIREYLKEAGIDLEKSRGELIDAIQEIDAQEMLAKGKTFKEKYYHMLGRLKKKSGPPAVQTRGGGKSEGNSGEFGFAFRKLSHMSKEEASKILADKEELDIIARAKEESEGKKEDGKEE
ncbi:MAG TPA: hypothetical protein VLX91_17120 [Candidatus Acidoferrales bacterium]|nr:hypothetical protein [Candidatus Acidoferrales bacterium]